MKKRHRFLWIGLAMMVIAAVSAIIYWGLMPLPAPIPTQGEVIDAETGKAIAGAQLRTRWRLYDYPMLDGAGSYELSSLSVTNDKGHFSLVVPDHRRGLWRTETYPPSITAAGYKACVFDEGHGVEYIHGESVIIRLTPE